MNDAQIKHMVDRFLGWRLPENFNPDGGISFKKAINADRPSWPQNNEPVGTNLLDATQAEEMVRYMVEGIPVAESAAIPPAPPICNESFMDGPVEKRCARTNGHSGRHSPYMDSPQRPPVQDHDPRVDTRSLGMKKED